MEEGREEVDGLKIVELMVLDMEQQE